LLNYLRKRKNLMQVNSTNTPFITWAPPGHFYSPLPSYDDVISHGGEFFANAKQDLYGINLNVDTQLQLLEQFQSYYNDLPFHDEKTKELRYYYKNDFYSYGDAIILYSFIRHLKPNRIIEVGSGFSSAVMLDTNDLFFNGSIEFKFIEPYPDRLLSLITQKDTIKLIQQQVQNMDAEHFMQLKSNDILFIDSSHVSKFGSDVNFLIFQVLPQLNQGVYVHFHDIFYPFEYPKSWYMEGRCWNEAYLLRAFLQHNDSFEIVYWNNYIFNFHFETMLRKLPLTANNSGGSIWLRKVK